MAGLGRRLLVDARHGPLPLGIASLRADGLQPSPRAAKLAEIGEAAAGHLLRVFPTVEVLVLTLVLAAVWPCVLWHLAWRLNVVSDAADFAKAIADGLCFTAGLFLALAFLYQFCRRNGLGDAHFSWPVANLRSLRRYARWAMLLILPLGFVAVAAELARRRAGRESAGPIVFRCGHGDFVAPGGSTLFGPAAASSSRSSPWRQQWLARLRFLWHPAGGCCR